jgi:hypothetical protein
MGKSPDGEEVTLAGGAATSEVVRVGDTVRRTTGRSTPAVHALLRHLEAKGFDGVPRVLGFDERGREILTFIEGRPGTRPWPEELRTGAGLTAAVRLLADYQDAVADFVPPAGAERPIGADN